MKAKIRNIATIGLLVLILSACAVMQNSEGDQGTTKMRKSPCASLWTARHV